MINIPRASSEVTKPHSTLYRVSVVFTTMRPLDVNLSWQKSQWIIVLGFRASAEMLLIFAFPVILELASKRCVSVLLFLFLCVAFLLHPAVYSFIISFALKHKSHLFFSLKFRILRGY